MKLTTLLIIGFMLLQVNLTAQIPQLSHALIYQAVVRNNLGNAIPNHFVGLRFSILDNSASGNVVNIETLNTTTNQFGLINADIGKGTVVSGVFSSIDWAAGSKWLQLENQFFYQGIINNWVQLH